MLINRQDAIKHFIAEEQAYGNGAFTLEEVVHELSRMPSAEPEDYTEMKREFIRMAGYIDMFLGCSDEQKETLIGFISRLAEYMPWTEKD